VRKAAPANATVGQLIDYTITLEYAGDRARARVVRAEPYGRGATVREAGSDDRAMTDEVVLRRVVDADLPIFFEHQLDPEATQMASFPARDRDAFMAHWGRILRDPNVETRTVLCDGRVAGNVVSFEHEGRREVGYWLGRDFWGRGVATRALAAFLDEDDARPLYAHAARHNIGSIRVLEKCGFTVLEEEDDGVALILGR
jgi:RimJ/RimL family protein N-acetyltransferase